MRAGFVRCLAILLTLAAACVERPAAAEERLVFISSFAPKDKGAIGAYRLDVGAGTLKPAERTGDAPNPFYLAVSRDARFLYAIHANQFGGKDDEQISAYAIAGPDGQLKLLNRQSSRGTASCYLDVDATGKTVLVANYSSGSVASLPVKADGALEPAASFIQHSGSSVDPARQKGPHAHSIVVSPDNRFALSADLGLDQVLSYRLEAATAKLTPGPHPFVRTIAGAGPRHLTFHPDGKHVYVINEMANSVSCFNYEPESGRLVEKQTISTVPKDFKGKSYCADVKVSPDGRFLYGTNRGHDSIAVYHIDGDGQLTLVTIDSSLGKGPQNLAITPGGELLLCANMPGNTVAVFRIHAESGRLISVGVPIPVPSPSCIRIVPK